MKVCLINTPYSEIYGELKSSVGIYFALGLGYVASNLLKYDFHVDFLDPEAENLDMEGIRDYILKKKPDIVGMSSATPNVSIANKIAKIIKKEFNIPIILGGIHASCIPEMTLERYPEFDIIVIAEGEKSFLEICKQYRENKVDLSKIKGIAYRKDGKILKNPPGDFITDVNELPFPARQLVNMKDYKPNVHVNLGKRSATILTSRGCPYYCIYCASYMAMGRKYRPHSAKYVLAEMKYLVDNYSINHFVIQDDTFTVNKKRVMDICQGIIDNKWDVIWYCFARVDTLDEEVLRKMKESGCYCIGYGIESGDQQILNNLKKGTTVEKCREIVKLTKKLGIRTLSFFIFGNPGETKETMEKTVQFALELDTHMAFFNHFIPYPGTEVFNNMIKDGQMDEKKNWDNFFSFGYEPVIQHENISKEYMEKFTSQAHLRFYLRPKHVMQMLGGIKSASEIKTYAQAAVGILRQNLSGLKK